MEIHALNESFQGEFGVRAATESHKAKGQFLSVPKQDAISRVTEREKCSSYPLGYPLGHGRFTYDPSTYKTIDKDELITLIHYTQFMNKSLLFHVRLNHPPHTDLIVRGHIESSERDRIRCRLADDADPQGISGADLTQCDPWHLLMDDGLRMTVVPLIIQQQKGHALAIELPPKGLLFDERQIKRHRCGADIEVECSLEETNRDGALVDFNARGFKIRIPTGSAFKLSPGQNDTIALKLRRDKALFFEGRCTCIRRQAGPSVTDLVFSPEGIPVDPAAEDQTRSPRQQLLPSPTLHFTHPFSGHRVQLDIAEISTSGITVYENVEESILIEGMQIPDMTIEFSGALRIDCSAQVIYRSDVDKRFCRSGIAILDMGIHAYTRLSDILGRSLEPHSRVSNRVDMNELWEFFFDTGFIYPKKYGLIQAKSDQLKENFRKLYQEAPEIARHFVYQNNGRICAHISMVRAYERAWLIHHHAARASNGRRAGFSVLKQIVHYLMNMNRFPSTKMDHMMVYYRPENKFPDRVFGGFARSKASTGVCSTDLFAYLPYTSLSVVPALPEGWSLRKAQDGDWQELRAFYERRSGGLLLDALGLDRDATIGEPSLMETCRRLGFFRKCTLYSLRHENVLNAFLIVNQSDLGLNLSELLNSIKVVITNPELPWKVLSNVVSQLLGRYDMEKVPVLFYPNEYVKALDIPYEKEYQMWIYDARYVNKFAEFLRRKFRIKF